MGFIIAKTFWKIKICLQLFNLKMQWCLGMQFIFQRMLIKYIALSIIYNFSLFIALLCIQLPTLMAICKELFIMLPHQQWIILHSLWCLGNRFYFNSHTLLVTLSLTKYCFIGLNNCSEPNNLISIDLFWNESVKHKLEWLDKWITDLLALISLLTISLKIQQLLI